MLFVWLVIMVLIVFADQLTKYLTILFLKPVGDVPLWQDVFHLTYVENRGAAFGMLDDQRWVFLVISTVAIVAILVYLIWKKPTDKLQCLSLCFIVGGGIGNMIDRMLLGYVVDFLNVYLYYPTLQKPGGLTWGVYDFPVFNVADCFVTIGAGMMMLWAIMSMVKESKKAKAAVVAASADDLSDADPSNPDAEETPDAGE